MTTTFLFRRCVLAALLALLLVSAGCTGVDTYTGSVDTFSPTPTPEPTPMPYERDQSGNTSLFVPDDRVKGEAPWTALKLEQAIEAEINERRRNHSLEPLTVDPRYRTGPRNWSYWMAQKQEVAHEWEGNPKSAQSHREDVDGHDCRANVEIATSWVNAYDYTPEGLAEILVDRWMNSPPHRDAVLADYYAGNTLAAGVYIDTDESILATAWFC